MKRSMILKGILVFLMFGTMFMNMLIGAPVQFERDVWFDEAFSAEFIEKPFFEILFDPQDVHPPLYYVVLKVYATLFELIDVPPYSFLLRFLSSLIYMICVASLMYLIYIFDDKRDKYDIHWYGVVYFFMIMLAPTWVYYSNEIRMYALEFLFGIWVWVFLFLWLKDGKQRYLVLHYLFIVLAVMTHYYAFLIYIMTFLYMVICNTEKLDEYMVWNTVAKYIVCPGAIYIVWFFITQMGQATRLWLKSVHILSVPNTWVYYFFKPAGSMINSNNANLFGLLIYCIFMFALPIVFARSLNGNGEKKDTHVVILHFLCLIVPVVGLIIALWTGAYHHRYFLICSIPLYLTIPRFIVKLSAFNPIRAGKIFCVVIIIVGLLGHYDYVEMQELDAISDHLRINAPHDSLVVHSSMFSMAPLMHYLPDRHHFLLSHNLTKDDLFTAGGAIIDTSFDASYPREEDMPLDLEYLYYTVPYEYDTSEVYYLRDDEHDLFGGAGTVLLDLDGIALVKLS